MIKRILLLLIFVPFLSTYSQVPATEDSLTTFLHNHPKDTLYVWAMRPYALIQIYEKGNQTKGDSIANEIKILSEKLNYGRGIYFSYLIKAIVNQQRTEKREMLKNFFKCYETVIKYKLNKYLHEATLNNIAVAHDGLGNKDSSMKYSLLAIKVQEDNKLKNIDCSPYITVGKVLKFYKKYDEALKYFNKALHIASGKKDYNAMAIIENNIGNVYDDLEKPNEAIKHFQLGLKYAEEGKYLLLQTDLITNLGRMYMDQNKFKEAEVYMKRNETLCKSLESEKALSTVYINLGQLYQKQKKYALAESYFFKALPISEKSENPKDRQSIRTSLADFYFENKNFLKAYQYLIKANSSRDSAYTIESDLHTKELLAKYETEKKEQHIKLLDEEAEISRLKIIGLIIGGFLLVLLSAITIIMIMNRNKIKRLEDSQRIRNKIASDLHDEIGSTLSSISILSEIVSYQKEHSEYKPEVMAQISNDAREVIEKIDEIIWTVNPQNDAFYNLETRIKTFAIPLFEFKNIVFKINFPDIHESVSIDMSQRRDIYLIMKEAINNLIKYSKCKNAEIKGWVKDGILTLKISDDGIGFDTSKESHRNGLKNMQARADKINATLSIISKQDMGTEIVLIVKL